MAAATDTPAITFEMICDAALKLEPQAQEDLLRVLYESLHGPVSPIDAMDDAELEAELERRYEEGLRDPSVWLSEEEFWAGLETRRDS